MNKSFNTILISALCTLIGILLYDFYNKSTLKRIDNNYSRLVAYKDQNVASSSSNKTLFIGDLSFIEPANKAKDAVVAIQAIKIKKEDRRNEKYSKSNGSGVLVSSNGYVVTNYHVVEDASEINLILEDKREFKAKLIGKDASSDIAVIKIDAQDLPFLKYGNSDSLQIGEWVLAIGNPFKLSSSVTAGIVSAKARDINIFKKQGVESFIQTDAAINPGNSGGALVNTSGELIGINTAILTYSGKYEGFSFATPSNLVKKVITDIREYGAVQRAWLGITPLKINEKRAKALDLEKIGGIFIDLVERNSAASKAGLEYEDVIIALDDRPTLSMPRFLEILAQYRPGDVVKISYLRKNKTYTTEATLHNQLNTTDFVAIRKDKMFTDLGFELRDLDTEEKEQNNKTGVMVVSIKKDSKIESVNMDPGYIITTINGQEVKNVSEFKHILESSGEEIYLNGFYENYPMEWPYKFSK